MYKKSWKLIFDLPITCKHDPMYIIILLITNMAAANDVLMNKRFEEAFDFIKYVFKVGKHYDDQMRLIKAFCNRSNVFFNAIFIFICNMFVICINYYYAFDHSYVCITRNLRILYSPLTTGSEQEHRLLFVQMRAELAHMSFLESV